MVHPSLIEARIGKLSFRHSRWFRAEIKELEHILMDDEKIISLACGRYFGSFALLVATDLRLLLIDKRIFFMTIEDTRYDMISEINYNSQILSATVTVFTMNKTHKFSSIKHRKELRELTNYVQKRVMEFRQHQLSGSAEPTQAQASTQQLAPAYNTIQATTEPQPIVSPSSYYVKDSDTAGSRHSAAQVGHIAHLVGSAATQSAHRAAHLRPTPFHPYIQGSLITRRPVGASSDY